MKRQVDKLVLLPVQVERGGENEEAEEGDEYEEEDDSGMSLLEKAILVGEIRIMGHKVRGMISGKTKMRKVAMLPILPILLVVNGRNCRIKKKL